MKVARFGIRPPVGHSQRLVHEETPPCVCNLCNAFRAEGAYRNTLIEIERGRRDAVRALHVEHGGLGQYQKDVADADKMVEGIYTEIKNARAAEYRKQAKEKAAREGASIVNGKVKLGGRAGRGTRFTPPDLAEKLKKAKIVKKTAIDALREQRRRLGTIPQVILGMAEIEERAKELTKSARAHCGLYWGSYILVEDAHTRSRASLPLYDGAEPNDPRFVRNRHERYGRRIGREEVKMLRPGQGTPHDPFASEPYVPLAGFVGVQIQFHAGEEPFTVESLFGDDSRVQIKVDAKKRDNATSKRGQRRVHGTLRMRVASTETGKPVWADFPLLMHQPLPLGYLVRRVLVQMDRVGPREVWTVNFTLEKPVGLVEVLTPEQQRAAADLAATRPGAVAVNFGWRRMKDGGIRVASWRAERANQRGEMIGDLIVPPELLTRLQEASMVRGRRDDEYNVVKRFIEHGLRAFQGPAEQAGGPTLDEDADKLPSWFTKRVPEIRAIGFDGVASILGVPQWFADSARRIALWKSPARLASEILRWKRLRDERALALGNDIFFSVLEAWQGHDHHLWERETSVRDRAIATRTLLYRLFAKMLAANYDTLVIDAFDMTDVARRPRTEDKTSQATPNSNRHLVAPGHARMICVDAFTRIDRRVQEESSTDITTTCPHCGHVEPFDKTRQILRDPACSNCGAITDQDIDNACGELLRRFGERVKKEAEDARTAPPPSAPAPSSSPARKVSRREKANAARVLRDAKLAEARAQIAREAAESRAADPAPAAG